MSEAGQFQPGFLVVEKNERALLRGAAPCGLCRPDKPCVLRKHIVRSAWLGILDTFMRDGATKAIGVRDLVDWGISRSAAAEALAAFVDHGMLTVAKAGRYGHKGERTEYAFAFGKVENKSAPADLIATRDPVSGEKSVRPGGLRPTVSPPGRTEREISVRGGGLKSENKSAGADTLKNKEKERSGAASATPPPPDRDGGAEAGDEAGKGRADLRRRLRLESELKLPLMGLVAATGSARAANELALKWERDRVSLAIVRSWLDEGFDQKEIRVQARCGTVAIDGQRGHAATSGALAVTPRTIGAAA